MAPRFSTIIVTQSQDMRLRATLDLLHRFAGGRADHEAVLVDTGNDGIDRSPLLDGFARSRYVQASGSAGGTEGRDLGIRSASGEVLVFLCEGALLHPPEFLDRLDAVLAADPGTGIVAFKCLVRQHGTWGMDPQAFDCPRETGNPDVSSETARLSGCGYAARAEVFREVGLSQPTRSPGLDGADTACRALKRGWRIEYRPEIWVMDTRCPSVRNDPPAILEQALADRMRVAWMHLPWRQMLICMAAWTARTAIRSRGHANVLRAWAEFLRWRKSAPVPRLPMPPSVMAQISACGGQPWK